MAGALVAAITVLSCGGGPEPTATHDRPTEIRAWGCRGSDPAIGSGTAVDADTVLTVAHVVAGADSITVTDADGEDHEARLIAIDTALDLAVLDVPGLDATGVDRASLRAGDRGTARGMGTGGDLDWAIERVVVIRFADIYGEGVHERSGYELAANVERGDSGAGLFGDDGSFGGLVFAASRQDPGRAWATDIAAAADILAAAEEAGPGDVAAMACAPP